MEPFLIIVGIVVVGVLFLVASYYEHRRRWQFWNDLADEWGYRYRNDDAYGYCSREEFPLFSQGHSKKVVHLIEGKVDGRQICLFDYTYKTGSGKNQSTHHLSCLMLQTPLVGHGLTVQSENILHRIAAFLGFEDINFESEEFNRAFQIKCKDKRFAYDVFHPGMMEYFLENRKLCVEWPMCHILFYFSSQHRFDREDAERIRNLALGFIKLLPAYLGERQRGE